MKTLGWKQIVLVLASLGFVIAVLSAIEVMPLDAARVLIVGSMGKQSAWKETLKEMTPLLIAGLAVFVALRAGLFNIGAEGQLTVGAMAAVIVALKIPNAFGMVLAIVAGTCAGALWALPAGLIKAYRGGHEVITTIMLNNIALYLTIGLVSGPLNSVTSEGVTTDVLVEQSWLPNAYQNEGFRLSWALLIALALVWGMAVWFKRTVAGYELRATGASESAAATAGVEVKRVTVRAMAVSGALAGLAGAFQVLAYEHRFYGYFSSGFGFDALGVALLAGSSPWGVVPSAFLFAVLSKGTTSMQTLGVPKGLSGILLGLLIIVFAAYRYRRVKSHE